MKRDERKIAVRWATAPLSTSRVVSSLSLPRISELMARHGEHVVPIWQTDPHPEQATGARAINQEAIDLLCPGGSGRGQLEQTFAHNNELVSHFQNLGDRSGFLITHEVRPINSGQARYQAPLAGKIKKTSTC